jgi:hypothetical protein
MIPVTRNLVLPQIIDDELLTTDPCLSAVQPDDKPSYMAFFVNTLQLYEIMGDILVTLYSIEAKKSPDDGLTSGQNTPNHFPRADIEERNRNRNLNSVLRLEMSLHSWKKALPPCLLPETYTDKDTANIPPYRRGYTTDHILFRQANVLQAR